MFGQRTDGGLVINLPRFFTQLAGEIRRRKVLRVVTVYAVVAWVVLQVAVVVAQPLGFPEGTTRVLIIAAIVGFPVSFVLAWVIDIRPEGLIFDLPLFATNADETRVQRKSDLVFAGLLVLLLSGGSYYLIIKLVEETASNQEKILPVAASSNSIAVLAFENSGGDSDSEYFATGLAEEILLLLASINELNVASPTSSFQFKGKQIDVREIAGKLSVAHVLEGSARQYNDRVRAKAFLTNGQSGFSNWVRTFERPANDIFAVQQEIATSVVEELQLALSIESKARLRKQATQSSDAYILYLKGLGRLRSSLDADIMVEASQLFASATENDQNFSKAFAGICEAHLRLYDIRKTIDDFNAAELACNRASDLDSGLNGETNLALGKLYMSRGWHERADTQLKKALAILSDPVDVYIQFGALRKAQRRLDDAEKFLLLAVDSKPNYWFAQESLASFYYRSQRYEEAAPAYEKAAAMAPDVATVFGGKGATHWMLGDFQSAIAAYEKSLRIKPSRQAYTNIGSLHYHAGRFDLAIENQQNALNFAPNDHRVWGRLADAYLYNKNSEKALEAYARAAELAEEAIAVNSSDWNAIRFLGVFYARLDRKEEALKMSQRAIKISDGNPDALMSQALVQLEIGDQNAALSSMEEAVAKSDQFRQFLLTDPSLQPLKGQPRFQALLPPI